MNRILDRLYCGAFDDVPACADAGITCVLSLCEAQPEPIPGVLMLHAPFPDEVDIPVHVWAELITALTRVLRYGYTVLVHCRLGVSRSPTLCAAYIARAGVFPLDDALTYVRLCRNIANPHSATWASVGAWYAHENWHAHEERMHHA